MSDILENGTIYPELPTKVNPVVDVQAAETDATHPNYKPQNVNEFMVAIKRLLSVYPDVKIPNLYTIIKTEVEKENNMGKEQLTQETKLRAAIRAILKEAPKGTKRGNPFFNEKVPQNYKPGDETWEKDVSQLRDMLGKIRVDAEDKVSDPDAATKRIRGNKDEQAGLILQTLKDEFGIDMSSSQFQNFDKQAKIRWFVTAVLSEEKPKFLDQTINQYVSMLEDTARETGVLDKELKDELKELPELLRADPSASQAFSEFLQNEVQGYIDTLSDEKWADLTQRAEAFFADVPGGVMKYSSKGALNRLNKGKDEEEVEDTEDAGEKVRDPEYLRTMTQRRQGSKRFAGGGSPKTGGGSAEERFLSGLDNDKVPPEA